VYPGLPCTLRLNQELRRTQRTARPCAPLCGQIFPWVPKYDLYAHSARRFFFAAHFSRAFEAIAGRVLLLLFLFTTIVRDNIMTYQHWILIHP